MGLQLRLMSLYSKSEEDTMKKEILNTLNTLKSKYPPPPHIWGIIFIYQM